MGRQDKLRAERLEEERQVELDAHRANNVIEVQKASDRDNVVKRQKMQLKAAADFKEKLRAERNNRANLNNVRQMQRQFAADFNKRHNGRGIYTTDYSRNIRAVDRRRRRLP